MARPTPLLKLMFKYSLLIMLLVYLVFVCTLLPIGIKTMSDGLKQSRDTVQVLRSPSIFMRTDSSDGSGKRDDPNNDQMMTDETLGNLINFLLISSSVMMMVLITIGITATLIESVPLLSVTGVFFLIGIIIKVVYISRGSFMRISLSLPLLLIEILCLILIQVYSFRLQSENLFGSYIGSLFHSL